MAPSRNSPKFRCRAPTGDGTPCKILVSGPNQRCRYHKGLPALGIGKRQKKPPKPKAQHRVDTSSTGRQASRSSYRSRKTEERERRIIEGAINYCQDAIDSDALAAAIRHAADYASEKTWHRLTVGWSGKRCRTLAELARQTLEGKTALHNGIGKAASHILGLLGRSSLERTFAEEIAKRIHLPVVDEKMTAVARGLQITGIGVCCLQGYDLGNCACFVDVVKTEGKAQARRLIISGAQEWASLHNLKLRG